MTRKNYLVAITLITIIAVIQSCKKDEATPPPPTTLALNIKDINETVSLMLGFEREEVLNMNLIDLVEQAQHKKFLLHQGRC